MAQITIRIEGMDELFDTLGNLAAIKTLEPPMYQSVLLLQGKMATYPPQRPRSSYRRTGTLGRRWTHKVDRLSNGVQGKVGNRTEYAPQVQSKQLQSRIHQGRWQTDEDVLERSKFQITRFFENAIQEALP